MIEYTMKYMTKHCVMLMILRSTKWFGIETKIYQRFVYGENKRYDSLSFEQRGI
jgi:hypothetical protein